MEPPLPDPRTWQVVCKRNNASLAREHLKMAGWKREKTLPPEWTSTVDAYWAVVCKHGAFNVAQSLPSLGLRPTLSEVTLKALKSMLEEPSSALFRQDHQRCWTAIHPLLDHVPPSLALKAAQAGETAALVALLKRQAWQPTSEEWVEVVTHLARFKNVNGFWLASEDRFETLAHEQTHSFAKALANLFYHYSCYTEGLTSTPSAKTQACWHKALVSLKGRGVEASLVATMTYLLADRGPLSLVTRAGTLLEGLPSSPQWRNEFFKKVGRLAFEGPQDERLTQQPWLSWLQKEGVGPHLDEVNNAELRAQWKALSLEASLTSSRPSKPKARI